MEDGNKNEGKKAKEIKRNTAACEVCQERKRKCDGKAPCSFCVAKNLECKFTQQKKRGPSKKRRVEPEPETTAPTMSLVPCSFDAELLDKAEARKFLTLYFRIEHTLIPPSQSLETLLNPHTLAHKVQLYAALAYSAQAVGDYTKGQTYINQARMLSGSIYDAPENDTVRGFMMMRKYWYLVLDFTQCSHYSSLAWSLAKLIKGPLDHKIKRYCQITAMMSDQELTNRDKLHFLRSTSRAMVDKASAISKEERLLERYMILAADFIEFFDFNVMFPDEDVRENSFFNASRIHISEEARLHMLETISIIQNQLVGFKVEEYSTLVIITRIFTYVFCPMYQTIVNWRSGHISEALASAVDCIHACNVLKSANVLALVAGYTHICMLASMLQFLIDQGQMHLAEQVQQSLEIICKIRGPGYTPVLNLLSEYKRTGRVGPHPRSTPSIIDLSASSPSIPSPPSPSTPPSPPPPASTSTSSSSFIPSSNIMHYENYYEKSKAKDDRMFIEGTERQREEEKGEKREERRVTTSSATTLAITNAANAALEDWLSFYADLFGGKPPSPEALTPPSSVPSPADTQGSPITMMETSKTHSIPASALSFSSSPSQPVSVSPPTAISHLSLSNAPSNLPQSATIPQPSFSHPNNQPPQSVSHSHTSQATSTSTLSSPYPTNDYSQIVIPTNAILYTPSNTTNNYPNPNCPNPNCPASNYVNSTNTPPPNNNNCHIEFMSGFLTNQNSPSNQPNFPPSNPPNFPSNNNQQFQPTQSSSSYPLQNFTPNQNQNFPPNQNQNFTPNQNQTFQPNQNQNFTSNQNVPQNHNFQSNHNFQHSQSCQYHQNFPNQNQNFPPNQNIPPNQNVPPNQNFPPNQSVPPTQNFPPNQNYPSNQNFPPNQNYIHSQDFPPNQNFQSNQNFQPNQNFPPNQQTQNFQNSQTFTNQNTQAPPQQYTPTQYFNNQNTTQTTNNFQNSPTTPPYVITSNLSPNLPPNFSPGNFEGGAFDPLAIIDMKDLDNMIANTNASSLLFGDLKNATSNP